MKRAFKFDFTKRVIFHIAVLLFDSEEEVIIKKVSLKSLSTDLSTHTLSYAISEVQEVVEIFDRWRRDC